MKKNCLYFGIALFTLLAFQVNPASFNGLSGDQLYEKGMYLLRQEKFQEAIPFFKEAAKKKPNFAEAHYQLGRSYMKIMDKDGARRNFTVCRILATDEALKQKTTALLEELPAYIEKGKKKLEEERRFEKKKLEAELERERREERLKKRQEKESTKAEALTEKIRELSELMKSDNLQTVSEAIEALGNTGDSRTVEPLIEALERPRYLRSRAEKTLVKIGRPAVEPLIKTLKEKEDDADMQRILMSVLAEIGDMRTAGVFVQYLGHHRATIRREAVKGLRNMNWRPQDITERALYAIAARDWNQCVQIGEPVIQPLIASFYNPDRIRYGRYVLTKIGGPAVKPLIEALQDENRYIRVGAAQTLGDIGDERAINPLISALTDEYAIVRSRAAAALGGFCERGNSRAIEALAAAHGNRALYSSNMSSVLARAGELAVEPLMPLLEESYKDVRDRAIRALGLIGSRRAIELIIAQAKKADAYGSIRRALWNVGSPALEPLITALDDKDWRVRAFAAEMLGRTRIKNKRAVQPLSVVLNDIENNWKVRSSAAETLGKIGDKQGVTSLLYAMESADEIIRQKAAIALYELNVYSSAEQAKQDIPVSSEGRGFISPYYFQKLHLDEISRSEENASIGYDRKGDLTKKNFIDKKRGQKLYSEYRKSEGIIYKKTRDGNRNIMFFTEYERDENGNIQEKSVYSFIPSSTISYRTKSKTVGSFLKQTYRKGVKIREKIIGFQDPIHWIRTIIQY